MCFFSGNFNRCPICFGLHLLKSGNLTASLIYQLLFDISLQEKAFRRNAQPHNLLGVPGFGAGPNKRQQSKCQYTCPAYYNYSGPESAGNGCTVQRLMPKLQWKGDQPDDALLERTCSSVQIVGRPSHCSVRFAQVEASECIRIFV